MAVRARTARRNAILGQARRNLIVRTARLWSRSGRSFVQELNSVVQPWVRKILKEVELDIAAGELLNVPNLHPKADKVIQNAMREALAQGYWLQHVYMRECEATVHDTAFRGTVTLADNAADSKAAKKAEMQAAFLEFLKSQNLYKEPGQTTKKTTTAPAVKKPSKTASKVSKTQEDKELQQALEAFMNGKQTGVSAEWHAIIPEDAVKWLKGYTPTLAGNLEKDVLEKVREVIRGSMAQGTSLTQRMKDLQAAEPAISNMAKHRVEAIARTEVTRADTMGRLIAMKSNSDVIGVEFSAILDSRTTDICEERHGLVMRMDDPKLPYNTPPLHPNCRSLLLPATVYEYPDGLLTSHEFEDVPEGIQRPEDIEIVKTLLKEQTQKQEAKAALASAKTAVVTEKTETLKAKARSTLPSGLTQTVQQYMNPSNSKGMIRGTPKEEIDRKRGVRAHKARNTLTVEDVARDYKRVGIEISNDEAEKIHTALVKFTNGAFTDMRGAFLKHKKGEALTLSETTMLNEYALCIEYARIAPVYKTGGKEIYRGVKSDGGDYAKRLLGLKAGDTFDLELASSFSSQMMKSANFAGYSGIMFHVVDGDIKDAPSIRGLSIYESEYEVLVDDRMWKVTKVVEDDNTQYHFHHIWIERQKEDV